VIAQTGCEIGDLVNKLDMTTEKTVMLMDRLLGLSRPLLRLAASDRLMTVVSRLLDITAFRKMNVALMTRVLARAVSD